MPRICTILYSLKKIKMWRLQLQLIELYYNLSELYEFLIETSEKYIIIETHEPV